MSELNFVGIAVDISSFIMLSANIPNFSVVCYDCKHYYWRDGMARKHSSVADHKRELVLESDPELDCHQQRDPAELDILSPRVLRR